MIFYVAHGPAGACGPGCSDWIAAEGTVQWDTHKRLIAILDRQAGRKLPVVIHSWGASNLNVATSLGRILRDRGIDTTAGTTEVEACTGKPEAECFALKRPGGPLDAKLTVPDLTCDLACVLMLAGGVHRSLPAGTKVILSGIDPQPAGAQCLGGTARGPDGVFRRTVPDLSARHGRRARTARHRRRQSAKAARPIVIPPIRMGAAAHRHAVSISGYSSPRSRNSRRIGSGIAATLPAADLPRSGGAASSAR